MKAVSGRQATALTFGVFALIFCALFLARTRLVIGDLVQSKLTSFAKSKNIDLEVTTIRPHGMWGLSLVDVSLRIPRSDFALEMAIDEVHVTPELSALLQGEVVVGSIVVDGGSAAVVPYATPTSPKRSQPAKRAASAGETPSKTLQDLELRLLDIEVYGPVATKAPLLIKAMSAEVVGRDIVQLSGFGRLPDAQDYWVKSSMVDGKTVIRLNSLQAVHFDRWFASDPPLALSVNAVVICLKCKTMVGVEGVELGPRGWREDIRLSTPSATLTREGQTLELNALEMQLDRAEHLGFGARLARNRISYDVARKVFRGRVRLADESGGTMDVDWGFDEAFTLSAFAQDFHLTKIWSFFQLDLPIQPGLMNGSFDVAADLDEGIVELESILTLQDLEVSFAKVSKEPLVFPLCKFTGQALVDLKGRAASVSKASVEFGNSAAIHFSGQVVDAGNGLSFYGNAQASSLNALSFRDGLPPSITHPIQGAILDGSFGFKLSVGGHSAFSESLFLDGDISGDVSVQLDGPNADVMSLNTNGPPPMLTQARLETWRSYDSLPPLVATVMLASEDSGFFKHPGFDWFGFKRAMVHNLETQSLNRGGSTISQQVVKNLFLTHQRTLTRKLQEAYLTWRMESVVPKERILEVYINLAEWGGGAMGIAQAAKRYFDADPAELQTVELALLASILPSPQRYGAKVKEGKIHSSRVQKIQRILKNLSFMGAIPYSESRVASKASLSGQIGRLALEICDDDGLTDALPCVQ